jgi:hypothetical protein
MCRACAARSVLDERFTVGLNRDNHFFYEWTLPASGPKPHAGAFAIFIRENAPSLFDGGADFQDCIFLQGLIADFDSPDCFMRNVA